MEENDNLCSSKLLLGFKESVSTTQCTHVVNETINYYNFNKTNICMMFLDASKVFDGIRYCKLFKCILKHNVSPRLLCLLAEKKLHVKKWKSKNVSNNIKQC